MARGALSQAPSRGRGIRLSSAGEVIGSIESVELQCTHTARPARMHESFRNLAAQQRPGLLRFAQSAVGPRASNSPNNSLRAAMGPGTRCSPRDTLQKAPPIQKRSRIGARRQNALTASFVKHLGSVAARVRTGLRSYPATARRSYEFAVL